mmetsp:Transcript_26457/g.30361  ORF Transcript_26457/g.30361 Transcript_26457/m.30361 type:complete len:220 (-) Transcript_26457:799-1458(-)
MVDGIKLQYFGLYGRGDSIRALLHYKQVDFTDEVITFEQWPELKNSGRFPNGQLPVLETDGERFNQEDAILQYLGTKYDLVLNDAKGRYLVQYYLCATEDIYRVLYGRIFFGKSDEEKETAKTELLQKSLPVFFADFEKKLLEQKGNETGWLIGGKPTIADIKVVSNISAFFLHPDRKEEFYPVLTKNAPNFTKYVEEKIAGDFARYFGDATKRPLYPF